MTDAARPWFTVAIPAYRDRPGLERLLNALDAGGAALEVIVVDDASDDGTDAMIAARIPPPQVTLRRLRNDVNLGPGPSRNRAIEAASAPYLLFLDADDLIHRDAFACLAEALPRGDVDFTLFRHHLATRADTPFTYRMMAQDEAAWAAARAGAGARAAGLTGALTLKDAPMLAGMVNFPWTRLFRTEFLRANALRFPDLRLHEDVPFHWAAWLAARRFHALDHAPPLVHHFQLDQGGRATDAADARRLDAFRALAMTLDAHPRLSEDPMIAPVFRTFAAGLIDWALARLAGGPHASAAQAQAAALGERLAGGLADA
jgi:cellulose synthase/poly-beta-1,6-N-acetylglucosamine synthase-like glycosyltransferase